MSAAAPSAARLAALAVLLGVAAVGCASKPHVNAPSSQAEPLSRTEQRKQAASINTELGIAYMQRGELERAKEKLERALRENPRDPQVHSAIALLDERLGNTSGADAEFHEALRLSPDDPDLANNYGAYLCRVHREQEGVKRLLAVANNPLYRTPEAAFTNAAVCLRTVHRDQEAEEALRRALLLRPSFAEAVFQLADLELQRGQLSEARARIDGYIERYSATPDLLVLGVRIAHAQGDRAGEQRYQQRLRLDFPDSQQTRALSQSSPDPG